MTPKFWGTTVGLIQHPESVSDHELLRQQAWLGLNDPFYLSTEILHLEDSVPRTPEELRPIYAWICQDRPETLPERQRWLRFWSSPRFTAKTYISAVYILQKILRNRNIAIIVQGQEKAMAMDTVKLVREWLENPKIVQLYGEMKSDHWLKDELTIFQRDKARRDPTLRALGLDVPMQGKRCDFMLWDDLIGETNSNDEGILKVERRLAASMPLIVPGGEALYICTRWNPYDPSTDGFTIGNQPGILKQWSLGGIWDAPPPRGYFGAYAQVGDEKLFPDAEVGKPLFPGVLSEETIQEMRATMAYGTFASQILNDPIPDEQRHFSAEDFQYFDPFNEDGERHEALVGAVPFMAVDPNQGKTTPASKPRDEATMAVGFIGWTPQLVANLFLVEWIGGHWTVSRFQDMFFSLVTTWKPRKIFLEDNTGGEHIVQPIRNRARELGLYLPLDPFTSTLQGSGKKDARIAAMQEPYSYRRVWHARKLKNCKGEDQLVRWMPNSGGHDDYADVLAMLYLRATKKRFEPRDNVRASVQRKFNIMSGSGRGPRYKSTGV